jgi:LmbE family N-acetylglucosaminyl deacetylase
VNPVNQPRDSRGAESRVLVVGAHPDDEVLGMGGTVARHALYEGHEVVVLCVSDGSSSRTTGLWRPPRSSASRSTSSTTYLAAT